MENRLIKAAVAVALGTVANSALAFNPSVTAPDYQVVFAGATAASNSVRFWVVDRVCDTTQPVDVFRRWTGTSFGNDWAVACKTKTHQDIDGDGVVDAGETVAAKNVLFRKRDAGGSGWGVTPVTHPMNVAPGVAATNGTDPVNPGGTATGFKVDIMTVTAGAGAGFNCNTTANPPVAQVTGAGTNYNEYKCGSTNEQKVPDAGFSDIEPNKFFGINKASDLPAYTVSTGVSVNTFGALVFGTPVSLDLRNALQAVQFDKNASNCHPLNANYTADSNPNKAGVQPWSESEACMPNLTSTEIRSLFTGGIPNWNNFLVTNPPNPTGAKIAMASHPDVVALGTVPADKKVQICRRVPGSGTQAQFQAIFLNWPCDESVTLPSSEPGNAFTGPVVANNSGSSDVSRCLDDFNDGSNASGKNGASTKRWAIGINSTENNPNNAFNYRFIKIDGAAPTINAVHAGDYQDYAEQSFQYRTTANRLLNATLAADKTDTLAILAHIANQGNTPNDTASINTNYVFTWGQGGWLVAPRSSGGFNPSNPFNIANPVNSSTRAPFGNAPNTCHFPTTIKPVQVGL